MFGSLADFVSRFITTGTLRTILHPLFSGSKPTDTNAFAQRTDWPADSLDLNPMDYAFNGIVKQCLGKRKSRNLRISIKTWNEERKNVEKC
jgi:hypothetical protein